jgi:hypothetical protein
MMNKKHAIITDDPRLNYIIVPKPDDATVSEKETEGCGLAPNAEMTPLDKYDYYVPLPESEKEKGIHKTPLPTSFLQIKEGDVEAGIEWYKRHYPKVPDELVEIMARYNFGDLKYATRKSIRNNAKKFKKKNNNKAPEIAKGLIVKNQKTIITFD